jgi:uncharacterized repeat protein (TIGR03803 family)
VIATPARVRIALVCALAVLFVGHIPAQTRFEVVHTFSTATPEFGAFPSSGPLAEAEDGSLYGITDSGGTGFGTVYRLADGVVTTIASFDDDTGLPAVATGLLLASDGNMYGTTEGDAGGLGNGTVFRVTPDGILSVWARFSFDDDGATPSGRLIEGLDGNLYGTALFGPGGGPGVVFRVSKAGETVGEGGSIEPFATFELDPNDDSAPAGAFPTAGVTEVTAGVFYGTAEMGGLNGHGTIFRATEGSVSAVHSFNNADGSMPASPLLMTSDGISTFLYGTTTGGGDSVDESSGYLGAGTLFKVTLDPVPTVVAVASFDPAVSGEFPYQQGVVQSGDYLYGTTQIGGSNGLGTVYRWSEKTGLELVHALGAPDPLGVITDMIPTNTLVAAKDGALYGAALGPENGILFRLLADEEVQPSLEVAPATGTYGGSVTLAATLRSNAGDPIADAEITFSLNGMLVGPATTGPDGTASISGVSIFGIDAGSYPGAIEASFAGSAGLLPATAVGTLTVEQATPTISIADATYSYDGLPHPAMGTVTGIGGEDLGPLAFTYNGSAAPPVAPGSYTVLASYAGSTNYRSASATAVITILVPPPGLDGLIAAYGFDEGVGSTAGDASGKGHAGAIKQAEWTSAGRYGRALDFDGYNDWVTIADAADLDIRDAITLEAWVNPRSLAGWNTILMKESGNGLAYSLYANDFYPLHPAGYVNVGGSDISVVDNTGLPLNAWSHVAMTYDGAMLRLYINGAEAGRRALTGRIIATNRDLRIGGNDVWGEFFNGRIDEVRLYNRALQPAEIVRDMRTPIVNDTLAPVVTIDSLTDGAVLSGMPVVTVSASDNLAVSSVELQVNGAEYGSPQSAAPFTFNLDVANGTVVLRAVARDVAGNVGMSAPVTVRIANAAVAEYRFNEGAGASVLDASGNNNNGTITGGVTRVVDGSRGQVLSFNGSNGLVSIADAASLDLTTGMTLSAWVRPTSVDGWRTVVLKETDGGLSYAMYANDADANKPAGYVRIGSSEEKVRAKKRLSNNTWVHIATTFDGTTMRFYVNGEEVESRTETGTIKASNGKLRIGGNQVWGEWFRGQMDDVRIYNVAVGSAQIKADMK